MTIVWFLLGCLPPILVGWLLLRVIERGTPVLWSGERWAAATLVGITVSSYWHFLWQWLLQLQLTRTGYAISFASLLCIIVPVWLLTRPRSPARPPLAPSAPSRQLSRTWKATLLLLGLWTMLRIVSLGGVFSLMPTYFDDSLDNWNLRGKVIAHTHQLTLTLPDGSEAGVSSYPPAIPLFKAWLSTLAGNWTDPLVNAIHPVWYVLILWLLYATLRRHAPLHWSVVGTYILASLPLYQIHGTNTYIDAYMSGFLLLIGAFMFHAFAAESPVERQCFLRLNACLLGIVTFVKSEGLVLYWPLFAGAIGLSLIMGIRQQKITWADLRHWLLHLFVWSAVFAAPFIIYRLSHGLAFGNAKNISATTLLWQPKAFWSMMLTIFTEGNWHFLPGGFVAVLIWNWRRALRLPWLPLTLIVTGGIALQLFIFSTTNLAIEALQQTGSARGLVHLAPLVVVLALLLLRESFAAPEAKPGNTHS